jgi:hypothetical protein
MSRPNGASEHPPESSVCPTGIPDQFQLINDSTFRAQNLESVGCRPLVVGFGGQSFGSYGGSPMGVIMIQDRNLIEAILIRRETPRMCSGSLSRIWSPNNRQGSRRRQGRSDCQPSGRTEAGRAISTRWGRSMPRVPYTISSVTPRGHTNPTGVKRDRRSLFTMQPALPRRSVIGATRKTFAHCDVFAGCPTRERAPATTPKTRPAAGWPRRMPEERLKQKCAI